MNLYNRNSLNFVYVQLNNLLSMCVHMSHDCKDTPHKSVLLTSCRPWGSNSVNQAWKQSPLPTLKHPSTPCHLTGHPFHFLQTLPKCSFSNATVQRQQNTLSYDPCLISPLEARKFFSALYLHTSKFQVASQVLWEQRFHFPLVLIFNCSLPSLQRMLSIVIVFCFHHLVVKLKYFFSPSPQLIQKPSLQNMHSASFSISNLSSVFHYHLSNSSLWTSPRATI